MILDKRIHVCRTLPSLPPKFKQMAEMPTTDEERESSSEESDDSSMCDNDYDFNDA